MKTMLAKTLVLMQKMIPPHAVFLFNGSLQRAGSEGEANISMRRKMQ